MQIRFQAKPPTVLFQDPKTPAEDAMNEALHYFRQGIQGPKDNALPLAAGLYMMNVAFADIYRRQQDQAAQHQARMDKLEAILQSLAGKGGAAEKSELKLDKQA